MNFELIVYTAMALEPQQQQKLQLELQEKYQTEGVIFLVDPSLIGGMKLVFGDRIEDYSLVYVFSSDINHRKQHQGLGQQYGGTPFLPAFSELSSN